MSDINWLQDHTWAVPVLALSVIIVTVVMAAYKVKAGGLIAVISAFFLAALILYFPYLHKVRVGVLDAELQDRIQTADETISQLREIATFSVKQTLLSYVDSQPDGVGARERVFEQRDIGLQLLRELHVSKEQLADAVSLFNVAEAKLLAQDVDAEVAKLLKADQNKLDDYTTKIHKSFPDYYYFAPSADELKKFVGKYVGSTPELDEDFQDLAYFQANGQLRRPAVFFGRSN